MIRIRPSRGRLMIALVFTLTGMQGCSPNYSGQTEQLKRTVAAKIATLGAQIDGGRISNALLVKTYADTLMQSKPNLKAVAELLRKDGTSNGALYQNLNTRLAAVNLRPRDEREFTVSNEELLSLDAAGDPVIYNDSLIDVVNTLADLSGGELERVNIPADALTATVNGGAVPGSYLVGNPSYGQWQSDNRGGSFWRYYGQYRLFSDLAFGPRYYRGAIGYNAWYGGGSRYSYYGDYGRQTYGSRGDRSYNQSRQQEMRSKGLKPSRPAKQYGSAAGRARVSNYTQSRTTRTQTAAKRQSGLFGSSARASRAGGK